MGVKLKRDKKRHLLLSLAYKLKRALPLGRERKFKLFLDLEWIFDRLAHEQSFRIYDPSEHPVRLESKRFILEIITNQHTVLDIGCKDGVISNYIAGKAKKVIGIDYDKESINKAKKKYKRDNLEFIHEEALEYLRNQDSKFDILILSHILEHLDEPIEFISKFKYFFKLIYLEVPDFDKSYLNHYRLDQNVDLIYSDNDHISEFDRIELRRLILECGLSVIKEEYRYGVQKIWCKVN